MKDVYVGRFRQAVKRLRGMFGPRAAVLVYHRISELESDPCLLRVSPRHFEQHLQVIREIGYPMRLEVLVRGMRDGKMPKRAVCVTFDDGYQDNLYAAKPLLERYDLPATVFVTTGAGGRGREFWWDELERIFLQSGCLPDHLQLDVNGRQYHWDLGEYAAYGEADFLRHKDWTLLDSVDPTPRHTAFRAVHQLVMLMDTAQRQQVLDSLLNWAGMEPTVRPMHRALNPDEIVELARDKIIQVGAHTVNHLDMSIQPADVQEVEIRQSKSILEDWLGHAVMGFAYPYGFYSRKSIITVQEAGFQYACACESRAARRHDDLFLLPRVEVLNWDGDEFAQHLRNQIGH